MHNYELSFTVRELTFLCHKTLLDKCRKIVQGLWSDLPILPKAFKKEVMLTNILGMQKFLFLVS
jgi:hypothetical protein